MRWVIGILGLSACSVMAVGARVGAGLMLSTSLTASAPGVRVIPTRTKVCATVNAAANRYGRDDPAEDESDRRAGIDPHRRVLAVVAGMKEGILAGLGRDFRNDDNVRATGAMFGSWWVWSVLARARFDRVMP